MKDTPTIGCKEAKFAAIQVSITNQKFFTTIPMNRSATFWRLAMCLIVVFFSLQTTFATAKTALKSGISTSNVVDSVYIYATKPTANAGSLVTVEITTGSFVDIEQFTLPISWNPSLLQFISYSDRTLDLPNFTMANFNTSNVSSGKLVVNWNDAATTISSGTLFKITFRVIGSSVPPTPISFADILPTSQLKFIQTGGIQAPVSRNNGHVRINGNYCAPRPAGLSCQTAPLLSATEFPYYGRLPLSNTQTVPTKGIVCLGGNITNNHWFSFIAASTSLTLKVQPSSCTGSEGLQVFVYKTADCDTFYKVDGGCFPFPNNANTEIVEDLTGLVIGQTYYITLDGYNSDVCSYDISIANGAVKNTTQTIPTPTITGTSTVCGSRTGLIYSIPSVTNADVYYWKTTANAATITTPTSGTSQTSATINWGIVADSVCVRMLSRCDTTQWFCKSVKVGTPAAKEITVSKCPTLPYFFDGLNRYTAGDYVQTLTTVSGCDSVVTLHLFNSPAVTKDLTITKCAQDVYRFNNVDRRSEGDYSATFVSASGCDSIVTLHLFNYPVVAKNIDTTICNGTSIIVGGIRFIAPYNSTVNVPRASSNGCDSTINLKVTVIDFLLPTPTKSNDITCTTTTATLTAIIQNQPVNAQIAYEWRTSTNSVIGTTPSVSVTQSGTFTLIVTVTLNGKACSKTTTVSVTKTGNQPLKPTVTGPVLSCEGRAEMFTLPSPAANATSHIWTVSNGTFTTQTNQITTAWNANATASKVCVSAQNACGVSDSACVSVEIGRIPGPLSITGSTTVCPNLTVTYRVTQPANTTLLWSVTSGTAQNALNADSLWVRWATTTGLVTVTPSSRCGTGTPTNLNVQVSTTLPDSVPIQGIAAPCSNDTTTFTVAASASTTNYEWQVPTGATILAGGQGTRTIKVVWGSFSGNGQVFLTTKNACDLARGVSFAVVVKNATFAAPTINGSRTVCPSTQISFSTPRDPNIRSYTWTVPPTAIVLRGAGTDSIRVNWDVSPSGQVCLDVVNICGVRQRTCINIDVRADLDSLVIAGGNIACKDSTLRFCVPDDGSAGGFLWQIPTITGGTIVSGQGTSCINVRFASAGGTVRVVPVGGCSDGKLSRKDVVVKLPPMISGVIAGKNTVCNNAIETYTIGALTDALRYQWTLPPGVTFVGDSLGNTVSLNITNSATSGFLTVRAENACGIGNGATMRLTIVPRPIVYAGRDTTVCGKTYLLNGSSNGTIKTWSVVSRPTGSTAIFAFTDRSQTSVTVSQSGTYTFRFEEANGGECSMADSVSVTFRNLPTVALVDQTCNQEATDYRVQLSISGNGSPFSLGGSALGAFQGATFLSNQIASGTPYFFIVTDAFGCKSDTFRGTKQCPCYTSAGNLRADSLIVCYGTSGKATPIGDAKLDGNDGFEYVLHTGTATRIGNIFMRNKTGIFNFDPAFLLYDRVYYVTFLVGDQGANGSVDTSKRCASQSRGIPIVFKDKITASLTGDTTVCRFSLVSLKFKCNQAGLFDINYQPDNGAISVATNLQNGSYVNANPSLSATYRILSAIAQNGCKAQIIDSARVNLRPLPTSNAGDDRYICTNQIQLNAAENFAYKGKWTSLTSGVRLTDSLNARTVVDRLQNGVNIFIWTVQDTACLDYSVRDTVKIFLPLLPKAINLSLITKVRVPVRGNVTESAPVGTYSVTRLTNPRSGRFDLFSNGSFTYIPDSAFVGIVTFKYIICSDSCTRLCDTGEVRILIQPNVDSAKTIKIDVPNAITPNDDGKNDALIIDGLDQFGENELMIFNRWGDVLYKSKPYKNEWRGTNQSGNPLPEGTYYYVLRLNTADGKILRGDMTILR
jgi:gliding motility-associated-like protein